MGMDDVELIMAVEEAFEIELPDEEVAEVDRVIDLYTLVWSKLRRPPAPRCLSSSLFYRTRRALMVAPDVPRWAVYPAKRLEELLPASRRRKDWEHLRKAAGLPLPNLELPPGMGPVLTVLGWSLLLFCLAAYVVAPFSHALLVSLAGVFVATAVQRAVAPLAVRIPIACTTVGATVRYAVARTESAYSRTANGWEPSAVWERLRGVIVETLDIRPEEVRPEASFVDDLGVG